jgi:hypothetical protein
MRDCLFLVADKNMEGMFKGFFSRRNWHLSLGTAPFIFDAKEDLKVAHGQNDSGLYTRANELLLECQAKNYRHVVVVIDVAWDAAPGVEKIEERLKGHFQSIGFPEDKACAVVIDPELENWVWQNNLHVCNALFYNDKFPVLREQLQKQGFWDKDRLKPQRPKEAVEWVLRKTRTPRSSSIYEKLASQVSLKHCQDGAFQHLLETLRCWFPAKP